MTRNLEVSGRDLVPIEGEYSVVRPLVQADEALVRWNEYQTLVKRVVNESDIQSFTEDGHQRSFIKKSGWQKLATYYGISTQMVDERLFHKHNTEICLRAAMPDKFGDITDCGCPVVGARYVVRAVAPNGRSVEAIGLATFNEKRVRYTRVEHDLAGKAYTRAVNRAISAMVGAGEVSAEEKADEVEASGEALGKLQIEKYTDLWKMAPAERRASVIALLEAEGFRPGEFQRRGAAVYEQVISLLEGHDAMP